MNVDINLKIDVPAVSAGAPITSDMILSSSGQLTDLGKFVLVLDPSILTVQVDAPSSKNLIGDAKEIVINTASKIEKTIKNQILESSQERFKSYKSILKFVKNDDNLLELMAYDSELRRKVNDLIEKIIALEKPKNPSFLRKISNRVKGKCTLLEEAILVSNTLDSKFFGPLSCEEMREAFEKKKSWRSHDCIRIFQNLRRDMAYTSDMELDLLAQAGHKTHRLKLLEKRLLAGWKGLTSSGLLGEERFDQANNAFRNEFSDRFGILYNFITEYWESPRLISYCYQVIFDNSTPSEISLFVDQFVKKSHWCDQQKNIERERQMLRSVPLKIYFEDGICLSARERELAALYLIQSVKNQDFEGLVKAAGLLDYLGCHLGRIKNVLTKEELSLFTSSYKKYS